MKNKKNRTITKKAAKELIVGFGFLSGLWLAIGIDPEAEIFKFLNDFLTSISAPSQIIFFLQILPTALFIFSIISIYKKGGIPGFIAVGLAFLGGLSVLLNPLYSAILLVIALILGLMSFKK